MQRKRLAELGIELPLLPATSVGSLPETPELCAAREHFNTGAMAKDEFEKHLRDAAEFWIRRQEEIGLDILVSGEQAREDPVEYFASALRGFQPAGLTRVARNFYRRKPVISGKIRWTGPITVREYRHAQSLTSKPVKATLLGPYSLMDGSLNRHYPDRQSAALALAREFRSEVEALTKAGCRIIQIDEPTLAARPEEMEVAVEAIRILTARMPAYFVLHSCYNDFGDLLPALKEMPVHNLSLELSGAEPEILRALAESGLEQDLSIGVVDVESPKPDTPESVRARLKRVLTVFPADRVWASPDCGLKALSMEQAAGRLAALQDAAAQIRRGN